MRNTEKALHKDDLVETATIEMTDKLGTIEPQPITVVQKYNHKIGDINAKTGKKRTNKWSGWRIRFDDVKIDTVIASKNFVDAAKNAGVLEQVFEIDGDLIAPRDGARVGWDATAKSFTFGTNANEKKGGF